MSPEEHKQVLWTSLAVFAAWVGGVLLEHYPWWTCVLGLLSYPVGLGFFWLRRALGRRRAGQ